jgi:hypothetical protein
MKHCNFFVRSALIGWSLLTWVKAEPPQTVEHTIYIPYQEFWKVFEQENRGVFLPYEEYRKLLKAAEEASVKPDPKKMEGFLVKELSGTLQAGETVIKGTATLELEAFSEGWHEVPLQLNEWTVSSATLDGQPARLRKERGQFVLVFEQTEGQAGDHTLEMEFAIPYQENSGKRNPLESGEKGIHFSLPEVAVNRWSLSVPDENVEFNVSDSVAVTRLDTGKGTNVELFLGGHKSLNVKWTPEVEGAVNMEAVMQATVKQSAVISVDRVQTQSKVELQIERATVESVAFVIDGNERVVEVNSPRLKSWKAEKQGERQVISLLFQEPVKGREDVRVESERYDVEDVWKAPMLEVNGVVRQDGSWVVELAEELKTASEKVSGMFRLDVAQPQPGKGSGRWMGWEYRTLPAELTLQLEEVTPEIKLVTTSSINIEPRQIQQKVHVNLTIERAGIFQFQLSIPDEYELLNPSLTSGGGIQRFDVSDAEEGRKVVTFDFTGKISGNHNLVFELERKKEFVALMSPTGEEVSLEVPMVRGVGPHIVQDKGELVVGSPAFLSLTVADSKGLREDPWQELRKVHSILNTTQPQFGFRYAEDTVSLRLLAKRKEPYTTVTQMLVVQAESGVVNFRSDLILNVQYSGIRHIRLDVPTELKDRIRIGKEEIRKVALSDAPGLKEGMTAWRLESPSEFTGEVTIPLEWETPLTGLDVGVQKELRIPALLPKGVDRSRGQIILRKAESMDVVAKEVGPELIPLDPRHDLLFGRSIPDAALAFEYQREWDLTVNLVRYEPVDVKATSIDRAWIRQVLTRGGEVSVQAVYQLRSVRQRLELRLPEGAEFNAQPLRLNGRSVSLERGEEGQVYLPLTGFQADEAVLLELSYSLPEGSTDLTLPHFPEEPATQKTYLSVYVPENQVYLGHRGGWNPDYIWRVGKGYRLMPRGRLFESELWNWVKGDVDVSGSPLDRLSTDGQHVMFSTLRPETKGVTLSVTTVSHRLFQMLTIGVGVLLGLLLIRAAIRTRFMVCMALVALLALAGVFLPSLAHALINDATGGGAFLVLILWVVYDVVVRFPKVHQSMKKKEGPMHPEPEPAPMAPPPEAVELDEGIEEEGEEDNHA